MPDPRQTISVAMIAQDEAHNLPRTLAAVQWVDEIVIVDSGSTDATPEIASSFNARFIHQPFLGQAEQKNFAIGLCTSDWVLLIDADEVVTPALALEIQQMLLSPTHDGYYLPRLNLFLTKWMRHGGLYPDSKPRLFRRGTALVDESVGPHGTPRLTGSIGHMHGDLQHYGYPDFRQYLGHMNLHSSEAFPAYLHNRPRISRASLLLHALLNPLHSFVLNYVFRAGFLDGIHGLIFHLNHAAYVHWKYVKAWESLGKHTDSAKN